MSQENVELVRRFLGARDRGDLPAALACLDFDVEFVPLRAATEGAYRGHQGVERFQADTLENFESFEPHYELSELGERVLAWGTIHVRGKGGGVEMDIPTGGIFDFRGGKIVRWRDFGSKDKALSQENLQVAHTGYAAFNRGDVEAIVATMDPSIEWWPAADEPITDPYRGHDGYRALMTEIRESFPDLQVEAEEVFAVGDRVVGCLRFWGRGRDSGAPIEVRETHVARFRDGKIIEVREYRERADALAAVGLPE